jgi:hypothetical protein
LTSFRKRPTQRFIAFLVHPAEDFSPRSWQDVPKYYRVVEHVGPKQFRGRADAWRFIENKTFLDEFAESDDPNRRIDRWAVVID